MVNQKKVEEKIGKIVNIVETHMSRLYFANYKVAKEIKDVDLVFVDLRSIEARRIAAIKTAEIDAAYCPDLGSMMVEIDGIPFIVMRKFDSSQELDRLYEKGEVTKEHAYQIGVLFAKAHSRAKTDDLISEIAYKSISANWEELFFVSKNVAMAVGKTITEEKYSKVIEGIRAFIAKNDSYFQERKNKGLMKQCHGDGHAGNMFVEHGQVKIFDGIGFKDEFSYMDPISDVAFPIMDALARGHADIAKAIKISYAVERCEADPDGVEKLLDFYICYRAFVRGQISTMMANGMSGEEQEKMLQLARKYYDLAVEYLP